MQARIHSKNITLSDDQKAYIEERVERLAKYSDRLTDESTQVDVEVHHNEHKDSQENITLELTIHAPQETIRTGVCDVTVEAAIDQAFEKARHQIEKIKGKDEPAHEKIAEVEVALQDEEAEE